MSKPATRSRRKQLKKRHKAKMRKLEAKRQRREAKKAAQGHTLGATIMEPNEKQEVQQAGESQNVEGTTQVPLNA